MIKVSQYNEVAVFGGVVFALGDISVSQQPSSLKTNVGKNYVEKAIPLRNAVDLILTIRGIIDGRSRSSGQTVAEAIENDRASLIALEDGYKHAYSDGKHNNIQMAIVPRSLIWDDIASKQAGQNYEFTITLIQWR